METPDKEIESFPYRGLILCLNFYAPALSDADKYSAIGFKVTVISTVFSA